MKSVKAWIARRGPQRTWSVRRGFLTAEAAGGILLIAAAAAALVVANSSFGPAYQALLHAHVGPMTVHGWINDGLMALFFLLVGLEIKRELVDGGLSTAERRRLPLIAAAAGMVVPVLVYFALAGDDPAIRRGWAIPAATDIAFAIGVLALLGSRAPASLKLLLTAIAIIDDIGAIAIIALAYTDRLNPAALALAAGVTAAMWWLNRRGEIRLAPYVAGFAVLWIAILLSGVHATVAGVIAAATVPVKPTPGAPDAVDSPLHRLEHRLQRPTAYAIVPLFGFANAGVGLDGIGWETLDDPLVLAILLGLFVGKQVGIFGGIAVAVRMGFAPRPRGTNWMQLWGMALLAGIGFTMSLFIGGLAFDDPKVMERVQMGVLAGSILSAVIGYGVLRWAPRNR